MDQVPLQWDKCPGPRLRLKSKVARNRIWRNIEFSKRVKQLHEPLREDHVAHKPNISSTPCRRRPLAGVQFGRIRRSWVGKVVLYRRGIGVCNIVLMPGAVRRIDKGPEKSLRGQLRQNCFGEAHRSWCFAWPNTSIFTNRAEAPNFGFDKGRRQVARRVPHAVFGEGRENYLRFKQWLDDEGPPVAVEICQKPRREILNASCRSCG